MTEFTRYDEFFWTYSTSDLDDARIPAFIKAITEDKPVSFQGKVYFIKSIFVTKPQTIIVLKAVK